jgi:SET domain-containing protein
MLDVIVKKSKIHGNGVFAARDFKKGEIVLRWNPKYLPLSEKDKFSDIEKQYIYILEDKIRVMQEPEKFVNHSCDNNTYVADECDVALRDIKEGEEITANYNNDGLTKFDCKCDADKCRKMIH